jgi:ABC-type transport system substrate-binding protein/class 3 adenylate cyclase
VELREERRVVTALFADLVGSTQLGERLDPEELKLVVGEAVSRMVRAVQSFDGTVKDLAGDGVLALFGAPVAHEDDQERAVRAGLKIVDEIQSFASEVERSWGITGVGVRVGVTTGPVVTGAVGAGERVEYSALGDAVNVAARLQSSAAPGTVLVGEETREIVDPLFTWAERRHLELKGKSAAVTASAVTGATGVTRGRPSAPSAPTVGRDRELARARESIDAGIQGSGGVLFITGEPGIGKTRLVQELRSEFLGSSPPFGRTLWLEGRCVSYGETIPYSPFRDLLRSWLDVREDEQELKVRVALRRHIDRLFPDRTDEILPYLGALLGLVPTPEAQARLNELAPEALQYRTFEVVRDGIARLSAEGPVALLIEDLHWADATSLQLLERLANDTEQEAVLLICTSRDERDHPSWRLIEDIARRLPHRSAWLTLEALSGDAGRELLAGLVGADTLADDLASRILEPAEGNPLFIEELVRSLIDAGALRHDDRNWRVDPDVEIVVPPTVEKLILARIDRLDPAAHRTITAASVLGRQFGLPLLEAVTGDVPARPALTELMRVDLVREGRRWPEPEYRFKHALIQEAAYRTLVADTRTAMHRKAAEWLEANAGERADEVAGLLAYHWLGAEDEDKAIRYLTIAGDRARQEYALDEAIAHYRNLLPLLERRGEDRAIALVLFKLGLALHVSLRFAEANDTYERAFSRWTPPDGGVGTQALRIASSFLPNDPDPRSAIAWPNIQLCMQLFDRLVEQWPERTIVPSLAERWQIADDGLRYVFTLREGLTWSDGAPLTAHDVEFGIKRVLNPDAPGSSVAIYFVLENGQDYYLRRNTDEDAIGVRALDDRTVEFRLVAPAPYFMSVMNRPDGGPQPRHAIDAAGDAWIETGKQVVSGAFRIAERTGDVLVLERRDDASIARSGNVRDVRMVRSSIVDALGPFDRDELDLVMVRYTPRLNDLMPGDEGLHDARIGPAAWSAYLRFDHQHPITSNLDLRLALAHAIDREAVAAACPANLIVATGGVVPPALQGHTPDIALRFDPELARRYLERSGFRGELEVAGMEVWQEVLGVLAKSWGDVFGRDVQVRTWSWRPEEATQVGGRPDTAYLRITGWFPGYADPEYFLRLLFQSDSRTNEGGFSSARFDDLIERARREPNERQRLQLFHEADRMAVLEEVACIPLVYGRNVAYVKERVAGWWEFGKTSANFADLHVAD